MLQESRFKNYKSHLELVLNEYKEVCQSIPEQLQKLFKPHREHVEQQLQPGLSTLAWNSMNIGKCSMNIGKCSIHKGTATETLQATQGTFGTAATTWAQYSGMEQNEYR